MGKTAINFRSKREEWLLEVVEELAEIVTNGYWCNVANAKEADLFTKYGLHHRRDFYDLLTKTEELDDPVSRAGAILVISTKLLRKGEVGRDQLEKMIGLMTSITDEKAFAVKLVFFRKLLAFANKWQAKPSTEEMADRLRAAIAALTAEEETAEPRSASISL